MAVDPRYSELELSAVQEIANIGTGNAATALGMLVGRQIDIGVPSVELVPLAEAAERIGPLESTVAAVLTPVRGDAPASLLLALPMPSAEVLCGLLGTDANSELGHSCLQEIGNILTGSYTTALVGMTGLALEPEPPLLAIDMLGAVVDTVLAMSAADADTVLFLQTAIGIEGAECSFGFLFVPQDAAVDTLLRALGVA
jgi:chemotaxis protein CheC